MIDSSFVLGLQLASLGDAQPALEADADAEGFADLFAALLGGMEGASEGATHSCPLCGFHEDPAIDAEVGAEPSSETASVVTLGEVIQFPGPRVQTVPPASPDQPAPQVRQEVSVVPHAESAAPRPAVFSSDAAATVTPLPAADSVPVATTPPPVAAVPVDASGTVVDGTPAADTTRPAPAPVLSKVIATVERLQNAPPPQTMVIEIPEMEGLRISVSVRGTGVHLGFSGAFTQASTWIPELAEALDRHGFDLAGFSEEREATPEQNDAGRWAPRRTTTPFSIETGDADGVDL